MNEQSLRICQVAYGVDGLFQGPARTLLDAEIGFADQYRMRVEAEYGEEIDKDVFRALFEMYLRFDIDNLDKPTSELIQSRTLDTIDLVLRAMNYEQGHRIAYDIDRMDEETLPELRRDAIMQMCRHHLVKVVVESGIRPEALGSPENVAGMTDELLQRTVNHLNGLECPVTYVDGDEMAGIVHQACDTMLAPADAETLMVRLAEAGRVLDIDVSSDLYPGRVHPMRGLYPDQDDTPFRLLASGLARRAAATGFSPEETWKHGYASLRSAMSSQYMGKPHLLQIPEVAKVIAMPIDVDEGVAREYHEIADERDHLALAWYIAAMDIMTGRLVPDEGKTLRRAAGEIAELIAMKSFVYDEEGNPLTDILLEGVREAVETVLQSLNDDFDGIGADSLGGLDEWRGPMVDRLATLDVETFDYLFMTGEVQSMPPLQSEVTILASIVGSGPVSDAGMKRLRDAMSFAPAGVQERALPGGIVWTMTEPIVTTCKAALSTLKTLQAPAGVRYAVHMVLREGVPLTLLHDGRRGQLLNIDQRAMDGIGQDMAGKTRH